MYLFRVCLSTESPQQMYPNIPLNLWLEQYKRNYSQIVLEILNVLRPQDNLVLQTQHKINPNYESSSIVEPANDIIKKVAHFFKIPVLDTFRIMTPHYKRNYLEDDIHQNHLMSMLIANNIVNKNYSYI